MQIKIGQAMSIRFEVIATGGNKVITLIQLIQLIEILQAKNQAVCITKVLPPE